MPCASWLDAMMSAKPWAEMTDLEKCESMVTWGQKSGMCLPCSGYSCSGRSLSKRRPDCPHPCPMVKAIGSCPAEAARLLKEGKV